MFLGACLDLGVGLEVVEEVIEQLGLEDVSVERREDQRGGLRGVRFRVLVGGVPVEGPDPGEGDDDDEGAGGGEGAARNSAGSRRGRSLEAIRRQIEESGLQPAIRDRSLGLFARLGEAEARIHGLSVDEVHFHELGAVDALVDLVGAAAVWEQLTPERVSCGPVNVGAGSVSTSHGALPVPAPATAELLSGAPVFSAGDGELVTPTGAVLLAELVDAWGSLPGLVLERVGYGLGRRELEARPNAFRLLRGTPIDHRPEQVLVVECTVDDLAGEGFGFAMERLLEGPALEVFFTPVQMKKSRPGTQVTVLCRGPDLEQVAAILMRETGSLGCRYYGVGRFEAERRSLTVATEHGEVRVKEGRFRGCRVALAPEYEDCRRLAKEQNVPWRDVYRAALAAARND